MTAMNYDIHGVKIEAVLVCNHQDTKKSDVYFAHEISHPDRTTLADHGIPVFYDYSTNFRYLVVDTKILSINTEYKSSYSLRCECGSSAVGSFRHSPWCPCN